LFILRRPYNEKTKKLRSEIPVDTVRAMNAFFENTPAEDGLPRIALIDTMDEMNRSAENAILKTLEEPPENALIILLANSPDTSADHILSNMLAARDKADARNLFWDCLQDILQEQASYSVTGEWNSAFKPLPTTKTAQAWMALWQKMSQWQSVESAINMDKKTVMLTALSEIRAA